MSYLFQLLKLMNYQGGVTPPTLTPIMTNFRIIDGVGNESKVFFDTPLGSVAGISATDFTIIDKTITAVNTVDNYFTVSSAFTYWDNHLIRKEGGDNSVVYDFTLQQIVNNINEPLAATLRYVTTSGGTGAGTEGDPWSLSHAMTNATSGMTVYIAPGTYPNTTLTLGNNGTITSPIKFIGTGANLSPAKSTGMSFNASNMPLIEGTGNSGDWLNCGNNSYVIFKNLQIQNFGLKIFDANNSNNIIWDNIYMRDAAFGIEINNSASHHLKFRNGYVCDMSAIGVRFDGYQNEFSNSYGCTTKVRSNDYYFVNYYGTNSSITDCTVDRYYADSHVGHGACFKTNESSGGSCEYNLMENLNIINTTVEFRHSGVKYNVARNINFTNTDPASNDGYFSLRDGCSYNILENCSWKDTYSGIAFRQNDGENGTTSGGDYNKIINCVFDNPRIHIWESPIDSPSILPSTNNEFINCTFKDGISELVNMSTNAFGATNSFANCIFENTDPTITGTFTPTITNSLLYNVGAWGSTYIGSNGNVSTPDPALDISYQPQATFTDIDAPIVSGVYYDANGDERNDTLTTVGAVLHEDELPTIPTGELVTDGSFSYNDTYWTIAGGTSSISGGQATIATTGGSFTYLSQDNVMTTGLSYTVEFDVIATNGETLASNLDEIVWNTSTTGHKIQVITAPEARLMFKRRVGSTDTNITLGNISVKLA